MPGITPAILLLCAALAGCDILGTDRERSPALLGTPGVPVTVTVPDTVSRNVKFFVEFTHYGSGSCTEYEGAEIEKVTSGAIVRPFISTPTSGTCTLDLQFFHEKVELSLGTPGMNEIGVMGRFAQRDTTIVRTTFVR